jgi:thiamine-phosphate pyrophosphorylase
MQIIVITPPQCSHKETTVITSLFRSGLQTLHLRKPGLQPDGFRRILNDIPQDYHGRIMIHSCHELLREYSLKVLYDIVSLVAQAMYDMEN